MGRVLGIIGEYNPFHNGHLYHMMQSIEQTNSNYTVCVISGNFVQRGNTSIVDKWTKAEMALKGGADLVIELPTVYSVSSAENFAEGAVKLLNNLGIVDNISFGMEAKDISLLNNIATVLYQEPKDYVTILNHELSKGISFPKARENAVMMYLNDIKKYINVMTSSNNILAIEYLKALKKLRSTMYPVGITREKVLYNDEFIVDDFASATAIRRMITRREYEEIRKVMPKFSYNIMANNVNQGKYVIDLSIFQKEILYTLRKMSVAEIAELPDVSEGLENAIKNASDSCNSLVDLISIVKSKRYTQTRIQRILVYALLGITKKDMEISKKINPYIRILGVSNRGKTLISEITRLGNNVPVITSVKKFMTESKNKNLKRLLQIDINATDIYTLGYQKDAYANLDYTHKIITL